MRKISLSFPETRIRGKEVTAAVRKFKTIWKKRKEDNWSQPSKLKPHLLHSSGQVSGDSPGTPHSQSPLRNLCDSKEADPAFFFQKVQAMM